MENSTHYSSYSQGETRNLSNQIGVGELSGQTEAEKAKVLRSSEVKFYGDAKEYFSIWIINLLLTIVTLGIYSAWAKVRTNRYFYANLEVDGHRFSYLGQPMQILKGRMIALLLFGGYFLANSFSPVLGLVMMLVVFLLAPFLICQSIKFNMRMTGYRNIRFDFNRAYGQAYRVFLLYPVISVVTLYLAMPWALKKIDEFIVSNMKLGSKSFSTSISAEKYFIAGFAAASITIMIVVIVAVGMGVGFTLLTDLSQSEIFSRVILAVLAVYFLVFLISSSLYSSIIRNHLFNHSQIQDVVSFESKVTFLGLLWLRTSNSLLLLVTAGLAIPWAKVRSIEFYAQATSVNLYAGADEIIVDNKQSVSAAGDEVANAFDVDVALG